MILRLGLFSVPGFTELHHIIITIIMGNRTSINSPQDIKFYFQNDLPKFIFQSKVGNGKFMKSYLMTVDSIPLLVKVYIRHQDDDQLLNQIAIKFSHIWKTLSPAKYPNLLPYQSWVKSPSRAKGSGLPIYLIRQYLNANLYGRLSTRPFLHDFEKLWIIYQLMKCIEISHGNKVVHGDIKPENIMCTTWNWIVLTDFSPYKPSTIPDDDPTDFQYFFDTMGRRRCSVAPERFVHRKTDDDSLNTNGANVNIEYRKSSTSLNVPLHTSVDIFSLGCTIAEVFMDGNPLLDLPGMLRYVISTNTNGFERLDQNDSPAKALLDRINNNLIRQVIVDMTQRDPEKRLNIKQYLAMLQRTLLLNTDVKLNNDSSILSSNDEKLNVQQTDSSTNTWQQQKSQERQKPVNTAFPFYFDQFLYPLFLRLHYKGITPDDRISILCEVSFNLFNNLFC